VFIDYIFLLKGSVMKRNILFGVGAAILLILVAWAWQSGLDSKSRSKKAVTTTDAKAGRSKEASSQTPLSPISSGSEEKREDKNQPGSISGTVRLKVTGAPVVGVAVHARNLEKDHPFVSALALTDEKGSYTLTEIPCNRRVALVAEPPSRDLYVADFKDGCFVHLKSGENKTGGNILLTQGQPGTISGTVMKRTVSWQTPDTSATEVRMEDYEKKEETPLAGVEVAVSFPVGGYTYNQQDEVEKTVTDKAGSFKFGPLRPGHYFVRAKAPTGAAFALENDPSRFRYVDLIKQPVPETIAFYFRMDGVSIEGRTLDTKGNPVAGTTVTATYQLRDWSYSPQEKEFKIGQVASNEKGEYVFDNLPVPSLGDGIQYLKKGEYAWQYRLEYGAKGYCGGKIEMIPFPDGLIKTGLKFEEDSLKRVSNAQAVEEYFKYEDVGLLSGHGNVITGVDLVLTSTGSISGRVVDSQGRNFRTPEMEQYPAWMILLPKEIASRKRSQDKSGLKVLPQSFHSDIGEGGTFRFENVSPGDYVFSVSLLGHPAEPNGATMRARNTTVTLEEGGKIEDLKVVVESTADRGTIVGRAVDATTGQPVESLGVKVLKVNSPSERNPQKGFLPLQNLAKGEFSLIRVSPGTVTLELAAPGYTKIQADVKVESDQTTEQTFQMGGGGTLSGRVVDALTQAPIEEPFKVKVSQDGKPIEVTVRKDEAKKGEFLLTGLPSGKLTVEITDLLDRQKTLETDYVDLSEEVEIVAGETTDQTFPIQRKVPLVGRLEAKGDVSPVACIWFEKYEKREGMPKFNCWFELGDYRAMLAPGDYAFVVYVSSRCGFQGKTEVRIYEHERVEIKPRGETRQDFIFPQGVATLKGVFKASNRDLRGRVLVFKGSVPAPTSTSPFVNESLVASAENLQEGGLFEIRLPAGRYTVFARCLEPQPGKSVVAGKSQEVTLTEGQALTVDFEFP
jgi:hypothetical protein